MKKVFGTFFIGVLLLALVPPVVAVVTWGDSAAKDQSWYEKTDSLMEYHYGLNLETPTEESYHVKSMTNTLPLNFDILQANDTFIYTIQGSDYTFYPLDDPIPLVEVFLLQLPVQINGSSYFAYLFNQTTDLEYLTNATITSTSIENNQAIMHGVHIEYNFQFEVTYIWSTTSGKLLEKRATGENGGELLIVPGIPPKVSTFLIILLAVILLAISVLSWWSTKNSVDNLRKGPTTLKIGGLILSIILAGTMTLSFIYTIWYGFMT